MKEPNLNNQALDTCLVLQTQNLNQRLNGKLIKKMHMKDLFDMFAGTSVGSIITGALVFPPGTEH